jgi:hypothetical protein
VLLGRRAPDLAADPGRWHVSPSGTLEPGAGLEDQVDRELDEELGMRAEGGYRPLGFGFDLLRLRPEICLACELAEGEVRLGKEFGEARWLDPAQSWPAELTPAAAAALALFCTSP